MTSTVAVTQDRHISATPKAVWFVITTPEMHARLDSRCHVEPGTGGSGAGSEYVVTVRAGLGRSRLRYVIREAIRETRWIADVDRGGKPAGVQHAELEHSEMGTLLRWTVTMPTGRLTRRLVVASCERELEKWLTAVDRQAIAQLE